jgi:hypothetical protein
VDSWLEPSTSFDNRYVSLVSQLLHYNVVWIIKGRSTHYFRSDASIKIIAQLREFKHQPNHNVHNIYPRTKMEITTSNGDRSIPLSNLWYNAFMVSTPLLILSKRPFGDEGEGINREKYGVSECQKLWLFTSHSLSFSPIHFLIIYFFGFFFNFSLASSLFCLIQLYILLSFT